MTDLLDGGYTFGNFAVGSSNCMAFEFCKMVADGSAPQSLFPLMIYGRTGNGKTHLLAATAHRFIHRRPDSIVELLAVEQVMAELCNVGSIEALDHFRARLAKCDLLLLHSFTAYWLQQQVVAHELLTILNRRHAEGRRTVIDSDMPASEVAFASIDIAEVLAKGRSVEIGSPDPYERLELLKRFASDSGIEFSGEAFNYLASIKTKSVRSLVGMVRRIGGYAVLHRRECVDLEFAQHVIESNIGVRNETLRRNT